MKMIKHSLLLLLLFCGSLFGKPVETFYGAVDVEEPVLLELIESEAMQRLKEVHQYGISYYTTKHNEEYNRFDHSLGVFAILRMKGASMDEQIAGLLHDVSHTVFSHVGDYLFTPKTDNDAFQDEIHPWFLKKYGIGKLLEKHGYKVEQVLHKSGKFTALECELPDLCADRIDYNLQGAVLGGFLTKEEAKEVLADLAFIEGKWSSSKPELMKKVVRFSLHMTKHCWGSAENYLTSVWLAEAILQSVKLGVISMEDIYFGKDDEVLKKLKSVSQMTVKQLIEKIFDAKAHFSLIGHDKAKLCKKMKFRGIDPWIRQGGKVVRLTEIDKDLGLEYRKVELEMGEGWAIKLK